MALGRDLTISEVAALVGRSPEALRHWERRGFIPPARRDPMSGWRVYDARDVARIQELVRRGRSVQ